MYISDSDFIIHFIKFERKRMIRQNVKLKVYNLFVIIINLLEKYDECAINLSILLLHLYYKYFLLRITV